MEADALVMSLVPVPNIFLVERLSFGVVVTFTDRRAVLYSTSLLYRMIAEGEDLTDLPDADSL